MSLQPVLVAGKWQQSRNPVGTFSAVNPATKSHLPENFPISNMEEVQLAIQAGQEAAVEMRSITAQQTAHFLEAFANNMESRADELVEIANLETALPSEPRLRSIELPRTTNQLRLGADAARNGSWRQATIDTKSNMRSQFGPLNGPVVLFGPNNFPFAFNSISGGDFTAAVAAGNPVIAKANPGHPTTTRLLAEAASDALLESGMPVSAVQLLYHVKPEVGLALVSDSRIGATAFTGSRAAGLKLKEAADKAGKPIYLEMSSVNPVFILPGALRERLDAIAQELYTSCSLGTGQFCTKPGLVVIQNNDAGRQFIEVVQKLFEDNEPGTLLNESGITHIGNALSVLVENGAEILTGGQQVNGESRFAFENTLLQAAGGSFLERPSTLQSEAFGTVSLIVRADGIDQMVQICGHLEGNLTGCIYSHSEGEDDDAYRLVEPVLRGKVGRLLNDKMPTGVAVVSAMNHGGPYPATGHPGFTAVGIPASLHRFAALHCYDNVRHYRLPPTLQDENPNGRMWRLIDGEWSQGDV